MAKKKLIDTELLLAFWNGFKDKLYNPSNKNILDATTASYTTEEKNKLNSIENNANNYVHPGSGTNPHGTTKSDVGLGNVENFKAVSTVAKQGLSDIEKTNARANIGAGTSSFSGSYNDLDHQPSIPTKTSELTNDSGFKTTDNNTTYTLSQDRTDGHKITLTPSSGTAVTITIPDNDTWREVQDNLISTATDQSLSANQGRILKELIEGINALPLSGGTVTGATTFNSTVSIGNGVTLDYDETNHCLNFKMQ